MRLIDADDEKLRRKLMGIREAEWQIYGKSSCFRFTTKCIDAVNKAPTVELKPAWINCSLELPECEKNVLIRFFSGRVDIAHRISGPTGAYCWICRDDLRVYASKYVSDWAPIPES